jgi:hypothetical protein
MSSRVSLSPRNSRASAISIAKLVEEDIFELI